MSQWQQNSIKQCHDGQKRYPISSKQCQNSRKQYHCSQKQSQKDKFHYGWKCCHKLFQNNINQWQNCQTQCHYFCWRHMYTIIDVIYPHYIRFDWYRKICASWTNYEKNARISAHVLVGEGRGVSILLTYNSMLLYMLLFIRFKWKRREIFFQN